MKSLLTLAVAGLLLLQAAPSISSAAPAAPRVAVTLTPSAPNVYAGQSITVASNQGVTFTLTGAGTCAGCGVAGATSITYTAPTGIVPQNKMMGCQVMPNDSIFNTRIDNLPVDSRSSVWTANAGTLGFTFQPAWGISYADSSTPTRVLKSYYGEVTNTFPWPTGLDMKRESGNYVGGTNFSAPDHHVMTVKKDDCSFYESYGDRLNGATVTCQDGVTTGCNLSSAITYNSYTYNVAAADGTDAAGLPLAPLVAHLDEIKAGVINHAMRYTSALGFVQGSSNTGTPYLWPAAASNGCPTSICPNAPIIGARARLKASFNISTFSATAQVLLTAMQHYGIILADIGTTNAIISAGDLQLDPKVAAALKEIATANIMMSNMEFVDESSLQSNPNSYRSCPYGTTCNAVANTYETPANSVTITATPSSGTAVSVPVAVQSVSIGTKLEPDVVVMAGAYSWTIKTWVNGSTNQTVNWTLTSGVGSVTTAGAYTPPATTAGGTSAVLHGVAAADSAATIDLYLTIVPAGTMRLDAGSDTNTTDGFGNTWLGGIYADGWFVSFNDNYPGWTTTSPYKTQFETGVYSYGNDITYSSIIVPNGNYDVSWLIGLNSQCNTTPCGSYVSNGRSSIYTYSPVHLESQGQLGALNYDWLLPIGYTSAAPSPIVSIPAKVTDNTLYASLRSVANDAPPYDAPGPGLQKALYLNGLIISSDASSPHWTIDTQQQTTIVSGQTLVAMRIVDWFTGVNDPTWSVVGPPGITINASTGVVSAAVGTYLSGQPVVVKASDGTYSATATLYTQGTSYAVNPLPIPNHYAYKRTITVSHTKVPNTDQSNFPMMLSITDPKLATVAHGGHVQNAHGYDMIIASDSACNNKLNWEVDEYDPVGGTWIVWFKVPTLSHTTDTQVYACYSNSSIVNAQSPSPSGVWDGNYVGVYHFDSSLTVDSTANANTLTNQNTNSLSASSNGVIGGSLQLTGYYPMVAPAAVLGGVNKGTISLWAYSTGAAGNSPYVFGFEQDSATRLDFFNNANPVIVGWQLGANNYDVNTTLTSVTNNTWHHLVYTWDQTVPQQFVYEDGVQVGSSTAAFTVPTPTATFGIGGLIGYTPLGFFDEVHFSNVARSGDWLKTEYANQGSPSTFYTVSAETSN